MLYAIAIAVFVAIIIYLLIEVQVWKRRHKKEQVAYRVKRNTDKFIKAGGKIQPITFTIGNSIAFADSPHLPAHEFIEQLRKLTKPEMSRYVLKIAEYQPASWIEYKQIARKVIENILAERENNS
jgi:hypothetical protein